MKTTILPPRAALMASVALAALSSGGYAFAADAEASVSVEEIVVTGRPIADSQAAALKVQKESPSLVSVIAADAVGRLPDQNIAFAIGRLPGVAVERDQGQARYINLRGAKPNWTTVSFDGLTIISPEGRQTRFDNIPSALASQVIVTKAVTPDMAGETIAGNVNIVTRSAFDRSGLFIAGKAELGYLQLGGGEESNVSLTVSDRFLDGRLGVLAQGSFYHRNMVTDNWETDPYLTAGGPGRDLRPGNETRRWAREFENKAYRLTRENIGGSLKIEYDFDDNNRVGFSSIYTKYYDEELRSNYIFRMDNGAVATPAVACPAVVAPQTNTGYADICNGNTPQKGTIYGSQFTANFNSLESAEYTWTNTLSGKHNWSDWDVSWKLNYTQTEDGIDAPSRSNFASPTTVTDRPTVNYDFTDPDNNTVSLFRTVLTGTGATAVRSRGAAESSINAFLLPNVATGSTISTTDGGDPTFAYAGKFDVEREFEMFGSPFKLKFGGFYSARTKKHEETLYAATLAQLNAAQQVFTFDQIRNLKPYQADLKLGYTFNYFSKDALDKRANDLLKAGVLTRTNTNANYYRVQEDIVAGYAMGTWTQDWGNIVAGIRVEHTKNSGSAFGGVTGSATANPLTNLVTASNDYVLVFPSAHINWNLNDEMKVRVGLTTGAARPDFDELRPNLVANDSTQSIAGGNPDAKPEKAIGVDAYYEWYMASGGYLSLGVYYKDLKDTLFSQTGVFNRDTLNFGGVDRSGYAFSTLRNGGKGHLLGLEASIQQSIEPFLEDSNVPDWVKGFGIQANLNLNDSEITVPSVGGVPMRKVPLIGSSDTIYNVSLYYERYDLSVRLAYQYRTPWGQSIGEYQVLNGKTVPLNNGDIYWNSDEELDLSVRYQVNERFELTFDAANLTNDPGRRYGDTAAYPIEWERFGRRFIVGVNFTF